MTSIMRVAFLFIFCLSFFAQDAYSDVAASDNQSLATPHAVLDEKGMNVYIDKELFLFMLENLPLSCKLAGELGLTKFTVVKGKGGNIFREPGFKIVLKKVRAKGGAKALEFSYLIGIESPLPTNSSGRGEVLIVSSTEKEGHIKADIGISFYAGNGMLDELVKRFPIILKTVFSLQMEKVIRQAEELAVYFRDDADYLLEIVSDEDSEFTMSELKRVKEFLKRTAS